MKTTVRFLTTFCALILSACALHPLNVNFYGSSVLNPDMHSRSLPVDVHLYQLRSGDKFRQASFYDLWQHSKQVLGSDLLQEKIISLSPNEKRVLKIKCLPKANYIAAIAIYRKVHSTHWKVIKKIGDGVPLVPKNIVISLVSNRIYIR